MKGPLVALCLASLLLQSQWAGAQQPPQAAAQPAQDEGWRNPMRACRGDLNALCGDVSGLGARLQCLKTNQDKLSPECISGIRAVLGSVQTRAAAAATSDSAPAPLKACRHEIATLCPDIVQGEGGRIRCLRDNRAKVGPSCAEALDSARQQARSVRQACEADRARLCVDAGAKAADQMRCLRERQAELTGDCRALVAAAKGASERVKAAAKPDAAQPRGPDQTGAVAPAGQPPPSPPATQPEPPRR